MGGSHLDDAAHSCTPTSSSSDASTDAPVMVVHGLPERSSDAGCRLPDDTSRDHAAHGREVGPDDSDVPAGRVPAAEPGVADESDPDSAWIDAKWALLASAQVARERLTDAASGQPGGASAAILGRTKPDGLDAPALLDGIVGLQRLVNWAQAVQQRYLAALARPGVALPFEELIEVAASPLGIARDLPDGISPRRLLHDPAWAPALASAAIKIASVEVGCALRLAPITARSRTERAVTMVDTLPGTLAAQESGGLDGYRASIIADRTDVLDPDQRSEVEQAVLPHAAERPPSRVRELVDRHVNAVDPDAAARRETAARRGRGVRVDPGQDGMSSFRADLSAPDAQLVHGVLDHIAGTLQSSGLAKGRGRNQMRADVFTDLFHALATTGHADVDQPGRVPPASACPGTTQSPAEHEAGGVGAAESNGPASSGSPDSGPVDDGSSDSRTSHPDTGGSGLPEPRCADCAAAGHSPAESDAANDQPAAGDSVRQNTGNPSNAAENCAEADSGDSAIKGANLHWESVFADFLDGLVDDESAADGSGCADSTAGDQIGMRDENAPEASSTAFACRFGSDSDSDSDSHQGPRSRSGPAPAFSPGPASSPGSRSGSRSARWHLPVCVNVYVNATTLAGWDNQPGELAGHGIITADLARALADSAISIRAIAVHSPGTSAPGADSVSPLPGHSPDPTRSRVCGSVLDPGRAVYRPPDRTADHVTTRDRICSFPGCRARAERCDLDHRLPYDDGGATCPCNVDPLCRFHHLAKTFTRWRATPGADGALVWTSPTGRRYATEPGHVLQERAGGQQFSASPTNPAHSRVPDDDPPPF